MYSHLRIALLLAFCSTFSACVSLSLSPETKVSKDLYFAEPQSNFESRDSDNLDGYFVEPASGNSISIKSSCYDPADPKIETLEVAAFSGMTVVKEVKRAKTQFSKREALHSLKEVRIDGVPVMVEMLIFKKNNCNYLISHVGVKTNFNKTKNDFDSFLKNVRAP